MFFRLLTVAALLIVASVAAPVVAAFAGLTALCVTVTVVIDTLEATDGDLNS